MFGIIKVKMHKKAGSKRNTHKKSKTPSPVAEEKAINSPKQLATSPHSSITIAHGVDLPD